MKYALTLCLFVWLCCCALTAQVLPAGQFSCAVSASGLHDCAGASAYPLRRANVEIRVPTQVSKSVQELSVMRFVLAPDALLNPVVQGRDVLIVGLNDGKLVNERKSPPTYVDVTKGLVMLMPKEEPYLLRNIGVQSLDLVVIDVGSEPAGKPKE